MIRKLIEIGSPIVALGVGLMTENILAHLPWIGLSLIIVGGVILLMALVVCIAKKIWPPVWDWEFQTNYSKFWESVFNKGKKRIDWASSKPQREGDFYKLNLQKERVISGIWFDHGMTNEVPEEWTITFYNAFGGFAIPNKDTTKPFINGKDTIRIQELERPVKVQYIMVQIKKKRMKDTEAYYWRIGHITLRENRLLKRYCRKVIRDGL